MDVDAYLDHLTTEGTLLADAAAGRLDAAVPTCPGWSVRDLVSHVGAVYGHKTDVVARRRTTAPDAPGPRPGPDVDVIAWFRDRLDQLAAVLAATPPATTVWTWDPSDQTVAFWYRRMAQESLVHRIDAELVAGAVGPVDPQLAVDGVDELLTCFLVAGSEGDDIGGTGQVVELRAGPARFHVALQPDRVAFAPVDAETAASVVGDPAALLRWSWGRAGDEAVTIAGDAGTVTLLRHALLLASQ